MNVEIPGWPNPPWTDSERAANMAGAEQTVEAVIDGDRRSSVHRYPELAFVPEVRDLPMWVVSKHHRRTVHEWDVVEWRLGPIAEYVDVPSRQAGMFGLFAAEAGYDPGGHTRDIDLHVLGGDYSTDRWLSRRPINHARCDWGEHSYMFRSKKAQREIVAVCSKRASEYLTLPCGALLVAVATCEPCLAWLRRGGSLDAV